MDLPYLDCWQPVSNSAAYNLAYRRVPVSATGVPTCGAFWCVQQDAYNPAFLKAARTIVCASAWICFR